MYLLRVPPRKSAHWTPPEGEDVVTADELYLEPGARGIRKSDAAGEEGGQQREAIPKPTETYGVHDASGDVPELSGVRGDSVTQLPHVVR